MRQLNLGVLQHLLNLDVPYPNFPVWAEKLEYVVDGAISLF